MTVSRDALTSPQGLASALRSLFPDFGDEELFEEIRSGEASLHSVMIEFSGQFNAAAAQSAQLSGLASLVSQSVATTDSLENAVGTCFLEHLRQVDRQGRLWKCLSPDVRAYIRAN